jgi:hypothetical protein
MDITGQLATDSSNNWSAGDSASVLGPTASRSVSRIAGSLCGGHAFWRLLNGSGILLPHQPSPPGPWNFPRGGGFLVDEFLFSHHHLLHTNQAFLLPGRRRRRVAGERRLPSIAWIDYLLSVSMDAVGLWPGMADRRPTGCRIEAGAPLRRSECGTTASSRPYWPNSCDVKYRDLQ